MEVFEKVILLKKELDTLRPLSKEDEARVMQKFRLDWNYHSNHIEGNTLTYGETKALILFGLTAQGKPLKDHFEVTGHNEAVEWIVDVIKQERPLTEMFIRELHKLILKESYEVDAITPDGLPAKKKIKVGEYKTSPNHVKTITGEIFRFATPEETPALMHDLLDWYKNKQEESVDPILLATEFHYKFIRIHPFDDGNGRTARILMNFILMRHGYPPVIIKTKDKEEYFSVLRQADAGAIQPFTKFITQNLVHSLEIMIKGAKGESIEDPDDLDKEIALLEQEFKTIGQNIKVLKTQESLLGIFDHSVIKLTSHFFDKGALFKRFYLKSEIQCIVADSQNNHFQFNSEDWSIKSRSKISNTTKSVAVFFKYEMFKQSSFKTSYFTSQIMFSFNTTNYVVESTANKLPYTKLYSEQLTDHEIDQIVNSEMNRHKEFIQEKIKDIKDIE